MRQKLRNLRSRTTFFRKFDRGFSEEIQSKTSQPKFHRPKFINKVLVTAPTEAHNYLGKQKLSYAEDLRIVRRGSRPAVPRVRPNAQYLAENRPLWPGTHQCTSLGMRTFSDKLKLRGNFFFLLSFFFWSFLPSQQRHCKKQPPPPSSLEEEHWVKRRGIAPLTAASPSSPLEEGEDKHLPLSWQFPPLFSALLQQHEEDKIVFFFSPIMSKQGKFYSCLPYHSLFTLPCHRQREAGPGLAYHHQQKQKQKGKFCPCLPCPLPLPLPERSRTSSVLLVCPTITREKQGKVMRPMKKSFFNNSPLM